MRFIREYVNKPIGDFRKGDEYTLFPFRVLTTSDMEDNTIARQISFYKFGVLICFEDIFPYISREYVKRGANFLINITNDAWFGETAASRQHLQSSVFRAVENRVPVIRAANTGISCFIDYAGRITSSVNLDGKDIFIEGVDTSNIDIYSRRSHYTVYGGIFVYFCMFMIMLIFVTERFVTKED